MSGRWSQVSETWRRDHPWAGLYSTAMAHPRLSRPLARITLGTDLGGLDDAIASIAAVPSGGLVLDVPSGSGLAVAGLPAERLASGDLSYLATDISAAMLARTRSTAGRLGRDVVLLQADVGRLPLPDRRVDLTLCLTGLHCFPDPQAAVAELARVTRGRIELTWLRSRVALWHRPVLIAGRAAGVIGPSATLAEVTAWLQAAGFSTHGRTEGAFGYLTARRA